MRKYDLTITNSLAISDRTVSRHHAHDLAGNRSGHVHPSRWQTEQVLLPAFLNSGDTTSCFGIGHINCKGNQCRRYVDFAVLFIIEATGHGLSLPPMDGRPNPSCALHMHRAERSKRECPISADPQSYVRKYSWKVIADLAGSHRRLPYDLGNGLQLRRKQRRGTGSMLDRYGSKP